jgi:putative transposase
MSHIYYKLYYHIVWSTKRREKSIDAHIDKLLPEIIGRKISELEGTLLAFNTHLDHCHLLVIIPPHKMNISDFVGQIKGYSAHEINQIRGEKYLQWQQGYGIVSLSEQGIPFVKKYIKNQAQHHRDNDMVEILEVIPDSDQCPAVNGRAGKNLPSPMNGAIG